MKLKNKKGFTIVELVIVIAVIGILTAILVPVFINLTNKANEASDQSLVKNLNTALKMVENDPSAEDEDTHQKLSGKNNTMQDVVLDLKYEGYYLENLVAKSGQDLLWDATKNEFFLSTESTKANVNYWQIVNKVPEFDEQKYSYYAGKNFNTTVPDLKYGFDAGYNDGISSLKYVGPGATDGQTASIRTNGGALEVDAQYDRIHHYGKADSVDIKAVKGDSYREFGEAGFAKIANGRLVIEESAKIDGIYLVATAEEFNNIKLAVVGTAKLPDVARAEVALGTDESKLVVEVQSLATSETEPSTENTQFVWISNEGGSVESVVTSSKTDHTAVVDDPLPAAAAAQQDTEHSATPISDDSVARINATGYGTLEDAFNAAKEGDTVCLLKDINVDVSNSADYDYGYFYYLQKAFNIDGCNHTITTINAQSTKTCFIGFDCRGESVIINNLNIVSTGLMYTIIYGGIEHGYMDNCHITADNCCVTISAFSASDPRGGVLTINNSEFNFVKGELTRSDYAPSAAPIASQYGSDVIINNSSISATNGGALYVWPSGGSITANNCDLICSEAVAYSWIGNGAATKADSIININNSTITGSSSYTVQTGSNSGQHFTASIYVDGELKATVTE